MMTNTKDSSYDHVNDMHTSQQLPDISDRHVGDGDVGDRPIDGKARIRRTSIAIALLGGLSVLVIYLIISAVRDGQAFEYFKDVDQIVAQKDNWTGKALRIHGNVVKGTIKRKKAGLDYQFAIHSRGKWLRVHYTGVVPDTFKDCAEVVVKGYIDPQTNTIESKSITAKCPSKYDEKQRLSGCGEALTAAVLQ